VIVAMAAAVAIAQASVAPPTTAAPRSPLPAAQRDYLLQCGGCHGIQGLSAGRLVPTLKGQVGAFLCLDQGREYIARLPNVAFAPVDDQRLTDLLNYMASLDDNAYPQARAFTTAEVARFRKTPLVAERLTEVRRSVVDQVVKRCGGPVRLYDYSAASAAR